MRERRRWLESDEINEDVRELLRAAPVPRAMNNRERARSARSLGRVAALPAAAGVMFWIKNVAIAGILGAAGGIALSGAVVLSESRPPVEIEQKSESKAPSVISAAPFATPSPVVPAIESAEPESAPETPTPKRVFAAPSASTSTSTSTSVSADSLAAEAQKLEQARRALAGNPASALALLQQSAREFPDGKLGGERELLTIDALGRLGRTQEARARAERMLERNQGGLYEQRLRRMLETL